MIRLTMRILEQYNLNINYRTGNVKDRKIYKLLIATNYRDFCSSILTYILMKDVTYKERKEEVKTKKKLKRKKEKKNVLLIILQHIFISSKH